MLPKSISSDNRRRTATITSSADAFCAENRNQSQDQENEKQKFRTPRYVERRKLLYYKGKPKVPHQFPRCFCKTQQKRTQEKKTQFSTSCHQTKNKTKKIVKKFLRNRSFSRTRSSWKQIFLIKKIRKIWRRERRRTRVCAREREDSKTNSQRKKTKNQSGLCRAVPEEAKGQRPLMGTFNPHFLSFFLFLFSHFCGLSLKTKH